MELTYEKIENFKYARPTNEEDAKNYPESNKTENGATFGIDIAAVAYRVSWYPNFVVFRHPESEKERGSMFYHPRTWMVAHLRTGGQLPDRFGGDTRNKAVFNLSDDNFALDSLDEKIKDLKTLNVVKNGVCTRPLTFDFIEEFEEEELFELALPA